MQHGHTVTRWVVTTLLLSLVVGARVASAGAISITWDANVEPDVQGYRVYIGTQSGVYSQSVDVGNATTFTFNDAADGQRYCFAVAAYSAGPRLGEQSVEVCSDPSGNRPPTLTNPGNQSNAVGVALTLQLHGSDPESSPVTYSATGLPAGLTLDTNTGFISGTPPTVGTVSTHATVSDGNLSTTQAFTWTIAAGLPGVATTLRPAGAIATTTPTFEWESVATATSYRLWVDDASSTDPRIQIDLTPAQAGCATMGAVCHVSPGVALAAGRASWSVRASNASGAGPWSGAMDFSVPDTRVPTVTIATPTTASTFATAGATIALAGTASDDAGVTQVTWTNNKGGSGTATGTAGWSVASVPVVVGTNLITVTARDAAGNVATDVLTVTKTDGQGPTLSIAAPASSSSTTAATVAMNGSAADEVAVTQVTWISDRGGSGTASGTTAWSIPAVALKSGANVIAVTAHDAAGNKTTKTVTVTLTDAVAPVIAIATPTAADTHMTTAATTALGGTASDAFGVSDVRWSNDRGGSGVAVGTTSWSIAGLPLAPGANVITVTAGDAAGHTSTDRITVTSDGRAPTLTIASPAVSPHVTRAGTVSLAGTASDEVALAEVTWTSNRGGSGRASGTTNWSIANLALQNGVNVITVVAEDAAGNRTASTVSINRDSLAPTIAVVLPTTAATFITNQATVRLTGTAADDTGVTQVTWQSNRGGAGSAAGAAGWNVPAVALLPGANILTVTARDGAGNVATATLTVTLDTRAPVVAIQTPTPSATYPTRENAISLGGVASDETALAEVTWTGSQGGSGVATGTATWSAPRIPLKLGVNTLVVTARDIAGNTASATLVVRATDATAPTVRITGPSVDATFSTSLAVINLEGTSSDDFGVARVSWSSDRGASGVAKGDARWIVGGITLQPGVNVITVSAVDATGNASTDMVRIAYERGLPTLALTSPTTAATYNSASSNLVLTGVASDDSGIARVTFATDKGQIGVATGTTTWSIPSIVLPLGSTTAITVTAQDNSGNSSSVVLSATYVDGTAPVVTFYSPTTAGAFTTPGTSVVIGGTASDNVGVMQVGWTNDRGGSGTAFGTSGWSASGIVLAAGTNVITVTGRDAAGNVGTAVLAVTSTAAASTAAASSSTAVARSTAASGSTAATPSTSAPSGSTVSPSNRPTTTSTPTVPPPTVPAVPTVPTMPATPATPDALSSPAPDYGDSAVASWQQALRNVPRTSPTADASPVESRVSSTPQTREEPPAAPPVVRISSPTTGARFTTTASSIALAGLASHASGIEAVQWMTDRGDGGVADGTSRWTIPSLTVMPGTTTITATAVSVSGDITNAVLTVVRPDPLPKLSITFPTADSQWATGTATVALRGTATDNVTQVTWSSDSGSSGVAVGTGTWAISSIGLREGINKITLTGQDANGRTDRHVLTVTYRPGTVSTPGVAK